MAFQVKCFDYLAKPITSERLEKTLTRLFDDVNASSNNFIHINNKTYINQNDINYIKREGMKLVFKTNSNTYEVYSSFNKLSNILPNNFVRCHKSYIANVNNINLIESNTNTLFFSDDTKCYIGPKYKNKFMNIINGRNISNKINNSSYS